MCGGGCKQQYLNKNLSDLNCAITWKVQNNVTYHSSLGMTHHVWRSHHVRWRRSHGSPARIERRWWAAKPCSRRSSRRAVLWWTRWRWPFVRISIVSSSVHGSTSGSETSSTSKPRWSASRGIIKASSAASSSSAP